MRKRVHVVSFHLNAKEIEYLENQADASGLAREEYLRSLIMGAEIRAKPCTHHADLLHKIAGLCNNANQLAKMANGTGSATQNSVDTMRQIAEEIWCEVKERW
ncbi:MAG: hypothetical protein RR764_02365 [Oscillospiraceae bacterium]